ncbi:MAG: hypothetical protein H0X47_06860 [Nitrospirales bacterium]|nr:hypothetical protein [Nitrospirales bacterium]
MHNLDISTIFLLLLGAVAGGLAIYYSFEIVREWLGQWIRATTGMIRRATVPDSPFDAHIATQWTEGRLRLDALLALLQVLTTSLEQEVETLRKLDHASPLYEREARNHVTPTLRRFAFKTHLRNECRVLVALLQFCAQDLAEFQGLDMKQKLGVLAKIQAALEAGGPD